MDSVTMYHLFALVSVMSLILVHYTSDKVESLSVTHQGWFLSMSGSFAISYVFIVMLPKLAKNDLLITQALHGIFPYVEKHVYVMALAGFLFFFSVGKSNVLMQEKGRFYLFLLSSAFLNFIIGYAIVDINNPEVRPLLLFTIAMGLHFFTTDFSLSILDPDRYAKGKWLLILALGCGFGLGYFYSLSAIAIGLVSAFISGGVIVNVMRHEFAESKNTSLRAFIFFACIYALLLLFIGK